MKGKKLKLGFVSFEQKDGKFRGYLPMEFALGNEKEPEILLKKATEIYEDSVSKMISIVSEIKKSRANRNTVAARKIWKLGNAIFKLRDELEEIGLEIDGIYDHLTRDLKVKRKWLEKVIIFRRYIPSINLIPESLNWGRCEKSTRRKAERLKSGLPLS